MSKGMHIPMGDGKVMVWQLKDPDTGMVGILLKPVDEPHEIGSFAEKCDLMKGTPRYEFADADVAIWFKNVESARVLQDAISAIVVDFVGLADIPWREALEVE